MILALGIGLFVERNAMAEDASQTIRYTLDFTECDRHVVDVTAIFPLKDQKTLELMLPVWTPGSYLVREYAKNIEWMRVENADDGTPLPYAKSTKNTWTVLCDDVKSVRVRYRLYCREMSVRTNWVESDFAFLTGAATFLTNVDALQAPHEVQIKRPAQWKTVATSLPQAEANHEWTRLAPHYHDLVDSPLLLGDVAVHEFDVGGHSHYLANALGGDLWDYPKAIEDISKIVAHEQEFWGTKPYPEYWFLNIASEASGGLEHDNSSVLMSSRWAMKRKSQYLDWLSLVSHEFFHTWNVRRLRPRELRDYDYLGEQYFVELWIAEGITSYYDELFLAQTQLCTRDEYLARLSKSIATVQNSAGRLVQPLTESSWDAWIKFYRPDENASNARVSYYTKGGLVAMLLDCEIRKRTQKNKSLRDVMRLLWQRHLEKGYTEEEFEAIVSEVVGEPMEKWFDSMIREPHELDFSNFLSWYGLRFKTTDSKPASNDAKSSSTANSQSAPSAADGFLGCETAVVDGKVIVKKIPRGCPADLAGINVDDEIIALNALRVGSDLAERVALYKSGTEVEMLISRRGHIRSLDVTLGTKPSETWALEVHPEANEEQKQNLTDWLSAAN